MLLHGFSQTPAAWDSVVRLLPDEVRPHAIWLPGHGSKPTIPASAGEFIALLKAGALSSLPQRTEGLPRVLVGYSMGARAALELAVDDPGGWDALVMVSSGAGITDGRQRSERRAADLVIADRLSGSGIEEFAAAWSSLDLWADEPEESARLRERMATQHLPEGLAAALRTYGQGSAPAMQPYLRAFPVPTIVVHGELDTKYSRLALEVAQTTAHGESVSVVGAGHSLPLTHPAQLAGQIERAARAALSRRRRPAEL